MDVIFEQFPQLKQLQGVLEHLLQWLTANVFVLGSLVQIVGVGLAFLIARQLEPRIENLIDATSPPKGYERAFYNVTRFFKPQIIPVIWIILLWFTELAAAKGGWSSRVIESAVSLLTAWIIIRLASSFVAEPGWSRAIAAAAWTIAALNIVGLLDPTVQILDGMAITFGEVRVSVLGIGKTLITLGALLWLASISAKLFERRIARVSGITPSVQVLFGKLMKILLFTIAFVMAMNSVGIDLTAFAVFSGAVGLGIGFGLQKVVSNLISGVILLLDKSVKPGDVIAIGETYGWINSLGARYVSVITRDGTEHLIPNEELISQRVENWSYSNQLVRQRLPIGISYESDVRKAIALSIEAAKKEERVLDEPAPVCLLKGFGDNAVDLELRFWIKDPQKGLANIKNNVLLEIWDLYRDNGIQFPFPQRDLHIRDTVSVRMEE
ncbi:MAG: mechanosensitive ion channel [Rhodospirillaceae bacterium]|nr:mechanosensitive ion channel [Rhodospirillaceae bacterium]